MASALGLSIFIHVFFYSCCFVSFVSFLSGIIMEEVVCFSFVTFLLDTMGFVRVCIMEL